MVFDMKNNLMEDERNYKAQNKHTHQNSKNHTPLVSLLLWHNHGPLFSL